jgi:hypothetical protein
MAAIDAWLSADVHRAARAGRFFAALLMSTPFWLMKGQPWKAPRAT